MTEHRITSIVSSLPSPASVLEFTSPSHHIHQKESVMSVKSLLTPTSPTVNRSHLQSHNYPKCITVANENEYSDSLCYLKVFGYMTTFTRYAEEKA